MRRIAIALLLGLATTSAVGCGGGSQGLPSNPEVDNRDPEVAEADEYMLQQAAQSQAKAKAKGKRP